MLDLTNRIVLARSADNLVSLHSKELGKRPHDGVIVFDEQDAHEDLRSARALQRQYSGSSSRSPLTDL